MIANLAVIAFEALKVYFYVQLVWGWGGGEAGGGGGGGRGEGGEGMRCRDE